MFYRLDTKTEFIIGDDVIKIHPNDSYNVHFPYKNGDINLHPEVGGSQSAVLSDLNLIWKEAIRTRLDIDPNDLENFRVVLVIPALYKRSLIKHYMTLLLQDMGFGHAFVIQDHVAATFGAGLGNTNEN